MNRLIAFSFAFGVLLTPSSLSAAVLARDWKTPGDGLLTYDDVNQREWLDLTETRLASFPESNNSERYQNIISELGPGGLFEGLQVARSADLIALAQSSGINISTLDYPTNAIPTTNLISLVGVSLGVGEGSSIYSFGYLDEFATGVPPEFIARLVGMLRVNPDSGPLGEAGVRIGPGTSTDLLRPDNTGVWLFRSAVPEPCSAALILSCLFCRLLIRGRRL